MNDCTIRLHRFWQDHNQTSGNCSVLDGAGFPVMGGLSLERGWRHNMNGVSCIPIGVYEVVLEWSDKYKKKLWEIKGVPNRSECKFHAANYWQQLQGCVALGLRYKHINRDNYRDVTASGNTMEAFHLALKGHTRCTLHVTGEDGVF